jgi:hypothetical protein
MDSLPVRSEEALKKQYDSNRKGRTTHSTLREQVYYQPPNMMWRTPHANNWKNASTLEERQGHTLNLQDQIRACPEPNMWPTPSACPRGAHTGAKSGSVSEDGKTRTSANGTKWGATLQTAVKMWPTPSSRDGKGGYKGGRIRNGKVSKDTLDVAVQHTDNQEKQSGSLNPTWVEWLMGYPIGWLDLSPSETQLYRKSLGKSSDV